MSLSTILFFAGIYNLVWGAVNILFPHFMFDLLSIPYPRYIEFWQCIGMIVGVYGVGYLIASRDYRKHWAIVLVGFLGKVFGPIGFLQALITEALPINFAWLILFNDLIWWVPFFLMLKYTYHYYQSTNE